MRLLPLCWPKMSSWLIYTLFFFFFFLKSTTSIDNGFSFNGFTDANLRLDGVASIASNGLLDLTNNTEHTEGHAFHPIPFHFRSSDGKISSFSTTFAFAILPEIPNVSVHGLAFIISPTANLSNAFPSQYLGLFNVENNGNSTNHIFAVELDTVQNPEFQDIDNNHVGIDINSLMSNESHTVGYYEDGSGVFQNLSLISSLPMQVWIDFDGEDMQLNVTISPLRMPKPRKPLLSSSIDLSNLMLDSMHVGFSAATGYSVKTSHCILGWSFKMNGIAEPLDYAKLPSLPPLPLIRTKGKSTLLMIWVPITSLLFLMLILAAIILVVKTRMKYTELLEDWELEYGPHRFSYKDLCQATRGFAEKEVLGRGGFGKVYRGVLPASNLEVAVKKVCHESRQGMREFVAEIVSMGQLHHRNLVQLLGYCRRKGELLLVYDFMPNGSLDRFLYDCSKPTLNWAQRFRIIKGVASGLQYLHEDWEQVVIHRDIKASNVLLDGELNGRLGDFGMARLYDHGTDPQTTHLVGTMGYIAPELARTGKATTATDAFAFGTFLLEVACGRRPFRPDAERGEQMLMTWVLASWQRGVLLETMDSRLGEEYSAFEVELVLKLGLICSNPTAAARPSMRQVVQYLEGDVAPPDLPSSYARVHPLSLFHKEGVDYMKSFSSLAATLSGISVGR